MSVSIRTLAQLPEATETALLSNSYFEVAVPAEVTKDLSGGLISPPIYRHVSKKVSKEELAKSIGNAVRNRLESDTGIPNDTSMNLREMYDDFNLLDKGSYTLNGVKTFTENPIILNDGIKDFETSENYSVSLSALKRYTNQNAAPALGSNFGFVTTLSNLQNQARTETLYNIDLDNNVIHNTPRYVFAPQTAKVLSENEYIFKIDSGSRESKEWIAPASGIFTCYGWLDEINNDSVSNEKRWVALLGYQKDLGVWTTLQVQPFAKNNYLSYVGFTFPVHKGMKLKIQTGFAVGSNSDKYFRSNSSLANHVANAFLGGIYTGLSVDLENLDLTGNFDVGNSPIVTELSNMVCAYISHEETCDSEVNEKIDELSGKLSNSIDVLGLSSELEKKVNYIDQTKYKSIPVYADIKLYNRMFSPGSGNEDVKYKQTCLIDGSVREDVPLLSVTLDQIASNNVRNYYAPPIFAEAREGGEMGYVERAFSYNGIESLCGRVFSDGKYMFYCVSQDCTAVIRMRSDFSSKVRGGIAGYMLFPEMSNGYSNNIGALVLGKNIEFMGNINDPIPTISMPVKKGTIFMFAPWGIERIHGNTAIVEALEKSSPCNLGLAAYELLAIPPRVPRAAACWTWIKNIYGQGGVDSETITLNKVDCTYNTFAIWTADEAQRSKLISNTGADDGRKYGWLFGDPLSHGDDVASSIATIVELPY